LNVIGLGIAGLALIATLIDQSVSRVIAVGVLALMVIGAIVSRGRK
jgi:hypothetical protein